MAKRIGEVVVDVDRCKGCRLCVVACPTGSLRLGASLNRLGYHPVEFLPGTGCTACGVCFYACPEPAALAVLAQLPGVPDGRSHVRATSGQG